MAGSSVARPVPRGQVGSPSAPVTRSSKPVNHSVDSTDRVGFTAEVFDLGDVPRSVVASLPAGALAEGFHPQSGARLVNGHAHHVRDMWRAHMSGVTVIRLGRPLSRRPDGRFAPTSGWVLLSRTDSSGVPRRRSGVVPVTVRSVPQGAGPVPTGGAGPAARSPRDWEGAVTACRYLPSDVVAGVESAVPDATVFLGSIIRYWTAGDVPDREVATLLRFGPSGAVALSGVREPSGGVFGPVPWSLTQYAYSFDTGFAQLGR